MSTFYLVKHSYPITPHSPLLQATHTQLSQSLLARHKFQTFNHPSHPYLLEGGYELGKALTESSSTNLEAEIRFTFPHNPVANAANKAEVQGDWKG